MNNKIFHWDKFGESSTYWSLAQQGVNRTLMGIGLGPGWKKKKKRKIVIISAIPDGHS